MSLKVPRGYIREDDPKVAPVGHPAPPWLINYADLMTEMVAFFVIMYALGAALNKDVQKASQEIKEMMKDEKIQGKVEAAKDEGMRITMEEGGEQIGEAGPFFESGKTELTPRMVKILEHLSPKLNEMTAKNYDIVVEGHTDNVPIRGGAYPSNWELSTARATVVVRYLIDQTHLPPNRMGASGYGDQRPEVPNDSDVNRAKNRRVVFFIRKAPTVKSKPKGSE